MRLLASILSDSLLKLTGSRLLYLSFVFLKEGFDLAFDFKPKTFTLGLVIGIILPSDSFFILLVLSFLPSVYRVEIIYYLYELDFLNGFLSELLLDCLGVHLHLYFILVSLIVILYLGVVSFLLGRVMCRSPLTSLEVVELKCLTCR